ncbi:MULTISPECIES: galactokinase [unclassified Microbacterium]|uniref:galactokinase n=1 Tax=unclassified Microbacterium TaxID=2609290 RepID=UPI000EA842BF|nr:MULTISPECIES: galactokinase [unclassified Microbacterium]MBT2483594.1 galactokinase [Microbacterium sp. ISL-108]RKN66602.1 galactokinase [Microbacterium sp. CGR2]
MTDTQDAVRALFAELTGREPDGVWSAPGRVNLIGEHTDYNDGFVLPFAIPHRTVAAVGLRDDDRGRVRVASTFAEDPVEVGLDELDDLFPSATATADASRVPEWAAYPLGVAWALRQAVRGIGATGAFRGIDIAIASDVPVGAGLSSSAAIEGATASALNDLWSTGLDRTALARVGRRAENEAVGAPTGIMDQMASMLGEADAAIFLDCRSLEANLVPLGVAEAGLAILVMDTRVKHAHSTGGYRERRASCERGAEIMGVPALRDVSVDDLPRAQELMDDVTFRRVRHIVTENQRVLDTVRVLREQGARAIGDLLVASHASMRDDFEISVPELDTAVDAALAAGALGARMTGGGFGGAAIALIEQDAVADVSDAVTTAFAASGFTAPLLFTVIPSAGAHRDA